MKLRDIMLTMISYPEPTPLACIEAAAHLARLHDARLNAALCVPVIPNMSNYLADRLVGANDAIAEENHKSQGNAQRLVAELVRLTGADATVIRRISSGNIIDPRPVAEHARLFDLAIVPSYGHPDTIAIAEALIFSSGRPTMMLPLDSVPSDAMKVVIGWDGGGPAARAMGDALPFLERAGSVEIVTITGEKPLPRIHSLDEVRRHLERHDVTATTAEVAAEGVDSGRALLRHCSETGADMLVMGAYGQSRFREFVLGGATRSVLADARLPVLMSH
jgi:nucleotide-binding universal stress UspA family protein